jgi:hypothetical protein
MPRVAFFFGISIYIYAEDHPPFYCYGIYGDYGGSFNFEDGELTVN